jgi:hypothetical protein
MRRGLIRGAAVAAIATLATHYLAYQLAVRDPHQRAHLLEETGHGWLGWLWPMVVVAGAVLITGAFCTRRNRSDHHLGAKAVYLAAAGSFLGIEVFERTLHLGSLDAAAENLLTWQGGLPVLLGVVLLTVIAPLVLQVERAVHALVEKLLTTPRDTTETTVYGEDISLAAALLFLSVVGSRGPPVTRLRTSLLSR